jgi:hypothetical protein
LQAKIRGFRVDVVEIENTLRTIAGVRDAVVVTREIALASRDLSPTTRRRQTRRRRSRRCARRWGRRCPIT